MQEYIFSILAFVSGGGISTLISARYIRKTSKIDAAEKIVKFYEDHATGLLKRIEDLEKDVRQLKIISCSRTGCRMRINGN